MISLSRLFDLGGKTALVTGASYGLGVTFSETLAAGGANVVLAARSTAKLEAVARQIEKTGVKTLTVTCDVADAAQVESAAAKAWEHFGRVDILVNNAGQSAEGGMMPERIPPEIFEQTIRVNLLGTWYFCRAIGSRMLADGKGGSIINNASIAGLGGVADFPAAYQASKAAVINLTRNLACSWADRGVRVNAIAPGWFPSEMTGPLLGVPVFLDWAKRSAPMGRVGEPKELAGALLFLAGDASSFVTGQTIAVDGGLSAAIGGAPWPQEFAEILAKTMPGDAGKHIKPAG